MARKQELLSNRLLAAMKARDQALIAPFLKLTQFQKGDLLFTPRQEVTIVHFPRTGMLVSLVLDLGKGQYAETTIIGQEGALGAIISRAGKPTFARGMVTIGGSAYQLPAQVLQDATSKSSTIRDHFARYADCVLAQVSQMAVCNAAHDFNARLARWLLGVHDRVGSRELRLGHDSIAQALGVRRHSTARALSMMKRNGAIGNSRETIVVLSRRELEKQTCECYERIRKHFERSLPGVYPV